MEDSALNTPLSDSMYETLREVLSIQMSDAEMIMTQRDLDIFIKYYEDTGEFADLNLVISRSYDQEIEENLALQPPNNSSNNNTVSESDNGSDDDLDSEDEDSYRSLNLSRILGVSTQDSNLILSESDEYSTEELDNLDDLDIQDDLNASGAEVDNNPNNNPIPTQQLGGIRRVIVRNYSLAGHIRESIVNDPRSQPLHPEANDYSDTDSNIDDDEDDIDGLNLVDVRKVIENIELIPLSMFYKIKNNGHNIECFLCYDEFVDTDIVRVLPCNHISHHSCIDYYLKTCSHLCPYCKAPVGEYKLILD